MFYLLYPNPDSQTENVNLIRLEFDAMFSLVFGSEISETAIAGFKDAVLQSLSVSDVDVSEIFSISILPGSIIADITGTSTTISAIESATSTAMFSVVYKEQTYALVGQHRDVANSSSMIIVTQLLLFLIHFLQ